MDLFKQLEVWFVIGSQNLYGAETLRQVKENAENVVNGLNNFRRTAGQTGVETAGDQP